MSGMIAAYFAALTAFVLIDFTWIMLVARNIYQREVGEILRQTPDLKVGLVFFVLHVAGVMYFAVRPALQSGNASQALISGAFFGLVTYATYSLTNLSMIEGWSFRLGALELIWGPIVTGLAALVAFHVAQMMGATTA